MRPRSKKTILVFGAVLAFVLSLAAPPALAAKAKASRVDLNSATQKELEDLPGVGAATAKKIIENRPYSSVSDLKKAGVPAGTIDKIRGLVTVGRSSEKSTGSREKVSDRTDSKPSAREPAKPETRAKTSGAPVDLNTASPKELEALPGVGKATAKKIVAGRPYSSVADLSKAGVSAKTIEKISPLVTVSSPSRPQGSTSERRESGAAQSRRSAPSSAALPSSEAPAPAAESKRAPASAPETAEYQPPPARGMVWVNLETKIYHREGDHWYGKTKHGKYMSEADAVKAGYRLSREKGEPGR